MGQTRINDKRLAQEIEEKWKEYLSTIIFFIDNILPRALKVNYWCEQTIIKAFKVAGSCENILQVTDLNLIEKQMARLQNSSKSSPTVNDDDIFKNPFLLPQASSLLYLNFIQNIPLMKQHGSVDFVNNAARAVMGDERFTEIEKFSKLSMEDVLYLNGSSFKSQFSRKTGLEIDTSLMCLFISNLKSDDTKKQKVEKLLHSSYRKYFPSMIHMLCLDDCNFKDIILEIFTTLLSTLPISWSREFEEIIFLSTDLCDRSIVFKACQNTFGHAQSLLTIIIKYVAYLSASAVVKTTNLWESTTDQIEWMIQSDDVHFTDLKNFFRDFHKCDGNPFHLKKYIFDALLYEKTYKNNYEFWCDLFE